MLPSLLHNYVYLRSLKDGEVASFKLLLRYRDAVCGSLMHVFISLVHRPGGSN